MTGNEAAPPPRDPEDSLERERLSLVEQVHEALDGVMVLLSAAWIALLVAELVGGSLPRSLEIVFWGIWGIFVLDFLIEITIAPSRRAYLRTHWITALSLVLPAFRFLRLAVALRALTAARLLRTVGLLRLLTTANRGLATLRASAIRRGVPFVLAATALVLVLGAAGMAFFEPPASLAEAADRRAGATQRQAGATQRQADPADRQADQSALQDYADALWWTAYTMTTGAPDEPETGEGKLLGWLLSLYGLAVFGYLTAVLASHFVGRDREAPPPSPRELGLRRAMREREEEA